MRGSHSVQSAGLINHTWWRIDGWAPQSPKTANGPIQVERLPYRLTTTMSTETSEEAKVQDDQTQRVVAASAAAAASDAVRIQICTTGQTSVHQPAVFTTARPTPVRHSIVGSTGQSIKTPAPGRIVVMAVPKATVPQPLAPRPPQTSSTQLPANFQIPPGMVLIRSDSGQLMLVSRQTLAQAQGQQAQKAISVPAPRLPASRLPSPMVTTAQAKKPDKLMVIRVSAPPTAGTSTSAAVAGMMKTTVLNREAPKPVVVQTLNTVIGQGAQPRSQAGIKQAPSSNQPMFTITQETLENVKKCKNFLVTLIKLASSGSQSPDMATNVKALVRSLLDGSLEPEEFTNKLYVQLKSTPQPYLVPFLKKSLPAVRHLTADPQHFIQQAGQPKPQLATPSKPPLAPPSAAPKPSGTLTGIRPTLKHVVLNKYPTGGVPAGPTATGPSTLLRTGSSEGSRTTQRGVVVLSGQHQGAFSFKRPSVPQQQPTSKYAFKETSYKEDDDINDVASMAGVNLKEESVRILAGGGIVIGSVVRSCQDTPFLYTGALHARILRTGESLGVSEARPEAVTLVSNATQEFLRDLLEKLSLVAEHRKNSVKEDQRHTQVTDVRAQLHFLEQVEVLKRRRQEEELRETLLRLARRRSNCEDPEQQQLRQRAKEMQQAEQALLQHREANLTALAAIGPRKRRPLDSTGSVVSVLAKSVVTRVTMRDLLLVMEEDRRMRHSLTLYKALMR
ncbi:transcription initiation factor TFIID subunit 4B-like isoform X2 [Gadus macrocephalus]|uniref:transcription initiation factor TFIID subunit 4B-like isoform X2 n=1 Tax=Gadus macrocephalus TaxID=80720 RepID=UPI0028CB2E62|nr:transcription initiation factor TFIID subunit 4B-like isoform X2 [Gadus macrocephalus]